MEVNDLISYYNSFYENHDDFELVNSFVLKDNNFFGVIGSLVSNVPLEISVYIPINFPFQEITFKTKSILGFPHLCYRSDGEHLFCLNTPFVESIDGRLELETQRLNHWIKEYLNEGLQDRHYDYLIFPVDLNDVLFFSEKPLSYSQSRFEISTYGEFDILHTSPDNSTKSWFFADNLANGVSEWNSFITNVSEKRKGYWLFVDKEPVKKDKTAYSTWSELIDYVFPKEFKTYILERIRIEFLNFKKTTLKKSTGKKYNYNTKNLQFQLPLAIGYKIPSEGVGWEVHWELAFIHYAEGRKLEKVSWAASKNICEDRYFGRGGFCQSLRNKNIFVIGLGALGSSVCEILARGGIRNLSIADGDFVDTGNICRSTYVLGDYGALKAKSLKHKLNIISPFIEVSEFNDFFRGQSLFNSAYETIKKKLDTYDIVIDCTASNDLLYFLSNIETSATIISMSISNRASQMFCHANTEKDSLFDKRRIASYSFGELKEPKYFEGAGCFMPTFEASFFDINALLNSALRYLNNQFLVNNKINSFHLAYSSYGIRITDYKVLYQRELGFSLTVFNHCEEEILSFSRAYFPFEFGGVLIGGYSENGKHIYLTDVLIPEKFSNSRNSFRGDTREINKQIEKYHKQSHGNIIYLGDWHSHPNSSNQYSSIDYLAIENQALSITVSINNPLMAIIAIGRQSYDIGYYIYYQGTLYKFNG